MKYSERLEEIKEIDITPLCFYLDNMTNFDGKLLKEQWKWLINRVEELEEERDEWKDTAQFYYMTNQELREQNKHYKQALEFYADPMIWREGNRIKGNTFEMPLANNDNGHKARKALEGTDNE
ncbi:hypothetical protein NST17_20390 [Caldifermentibacillus hisashii]|uniref:Uncharacterized protein n=1 Tax=Caldifermentibacillus hisashii TaxID=996558 RepID=A0ABU9K325_9BACI